MSLHNSKAWLPCHLDHHPNKQRIYSLDQCSVLPTLRFEVVLVVAEILAYTPMQPTQDCLAAVPTASCTSIYAHFHGNIHEGQFWSTSWYMSQDQSRAKARQVMYMAMGQSPLSVAIQGRYMACSSIVCGSCCSDQPLKRQKQPLRIGEDRPKSARCSRHISRSQGPSRASFVHSDLQSAGHALQVHGWAADAALCVNHASCS